MACPVCFGDGNDPLVQAANAGIWFMLGIVVVMLSAFATFFIYLIRRGRIARQLEHSAPADAGSYARSQEGTA